jgi:putative transposase
VIAWHRRGFRLYWSLESRHRQGRASISRELIDLIHKMSLANPRWVSSDFFVVPTVFFRVLFVFVILSHDRRRLVHVAVTEYPTSEWVARQLLEALPWDSAPRYLLRDRDGSYGTMARHSRDSDRTLIALAERLRGAADRIDSPRVLGSRDHSE